MKKENLIVKYTKVIFIFLLAMIIFLRFSISQKNTTDISLLLLTDKQVYYENDVVSFNSIIKAANNTPIQNTNITFQISNGNSTYFLTGQTDVNGTYSSSSIIPSQGNYTIVVLLNYTDKTYQNITSFEVRKPNVMLEKNKYFINETIKIIIIASPKKYFNITISGPIVESFTFFNENETSVFNLSLPVSGNYEIKVNDVRFNIEILPYLGLLPRKIDLDFSLNENYLLNEIINLKITGTPNAEFNFEISSPTNISILNFNSVTDDNGNFIHQVNINNIGNYTAILSFSNKTLIRYFNIYEIKPQFKILLQNRTFTLPQNVSLTVNSNPKSNFILKIESIDKSYIFDLSTDEKGEYNFSDIFASGNYSVSLFFNEEKLLAEWFEVIDIIEETITNEITIPNRTMDSYYFIDSNDYQLYLSENITSHNSGIIVSNVNNVAIDCLGNMINAKEYGILVEYSTNVEIRNCLIQGSDIAVFFKHTNNIKIFDNTVTDNTHGIVIYNSSKTELYNNIAINNEYYGVLLYLSSDYSLANNVITSKSDIGLLDRLKQEK